MCKTHGGTGFWGVQKIPRGFSTFVDNLERMMFFVCFNTSRYNKGQKVRNALRERQEVVIKGPLRERERDREGGYPWAEGVGRAAPAEDRISMGSCKVGVIPPPQRWDKHRANTGHPLSFIHFTIFQLFPLLHRHGHNFIWSPLHFSPRLSQAINWPSCLCSHPGLDHYPTARRSF